MVGLQIFVEYTDAEGKTHESDPTEPVYVYSFDIKEAKASKVNEITVTFANPVEAENVTFAVTKGTDEFSIEDTDWLLTEDEAVLTMSANMTKGTYKVTATDKVTEATDYYEFDVDKQEAAQIVFKNKEALTDETHKEAYAYYDVKDQYGQSIRTSASIQWSGSCEITADKATGKLTLKKNDNKDWVYNEQIYITGVYIKNGTAESTTLTVGTQQSLNSIEPVGFLKKGTSDIIDPDDKIPADFKTHEYYLLFNALDQNGCPLDAEDITKEDVTFISTDPLVVKELTEFEPNGLTVKGTEYCAVFIEPGINVSKGGEVTIKAIANKTGNQAELNFIVGDDPVPVSFTIEAPSGTVADGDQDVVIPFKALDQDEKPITNFRALAKQEIFNKLSFTASEGTLTLKETDSGAAKLTWDDADKYADDTAWALSSSTDDIDRPVSLTVVVVSGESDNEMMYVQDKRRPDAIDSVDLDSVLVEGATTTFTLGSFKYKDQYGAIIGDDFGDDNGFFAAGAPGAGVLQGLDFANYTFGVKIEYAGTGYMAIDNAGANKTTYLSTTNGVVDGKQAVVSYKADKTTLTTAKYDTTTNIKNAATGEGFKFSIAKFKKIDNPENFITNPDDWDAVSPTKYAPLTVVDITQIKNFEIGDLNTFYVGALNITGDKIIKEGAPLTELKKTHAGTPGDPWLYAEAAAAANTDVGDGIRKTGSAYLQHVDLTGTYGGTTVEIPDVYYSIAANMLEDGDGTGNSWANGDNKFDNIKANTIKYGELYDKTTANGNAKPADDEVTATILTVYGELGYWAWDAVNERLYVDEDMTPQQAQATLTAAREAQLAEDRVDAANAILDTAGDITVSTLDEFLAGTYTTTPANLTLANAQAAVTAAQDAIEDNTGAGSLKTYNDAVAAHTDATTALGTYTISDEQETAWNALKAGLNKDSTENDIDTAIAGLDVAVKPAAKAYLTEYVKGLAEDAALVALNADRQTLSDAQAQLVLAEQRDAKLAAEALTLANVNDDDVFGAGATQLTPTTTVAQAITETTAGRQVRNSGITYDQAKSAITFSDQAPYAKAIVGLAESYTLNPENTELANAKIIAKTITADEVHLVDQYGVTFAGDLNITISNAEESDKGYAENNFKIGSNGTKKASVSGAELFDTFDLTLSYKDISATTKVNVGADEDACIENDKNYYNDVLKKTLETQRLAGLQ